MMLTSLLTDRNPVPTSSEPFWPERGRQLGDVIVVGAGLAGSLAALRLHRCGCTVTLIDLHQQPEPEFRAEQWVGSQMKRFGDLGLLDGSLRGVATSKVTTNAGSGRIIDRTVVPQAGLPYHRMVEAARAALPSGIRVIARSVTAVATGPCNQSVTLADGTIFEARLVVMATGLSTALPRRMGFAFRTIRSGHSLAVGFDIALAEPRRAALMPLIYYPESIRDRLDYLALFGMDNTIRANLFCYGDRNSAWVREFCGSPGPALQASLPGLERVIGPFSVGSPIDLRSNDLRVVSEPARDGVVFVGDAFQTPCPAAGTGIDRLLSDIDVLATHAPVWLASPGMGRHKIAAFYADPVKRTVDAECLRIAEYRRAVSTEVGFAWWLHRRQVFWRRSLKGVLPKALARRSSPATMAPTT